VPIENPALSVSASDYHTAGEPFRIVSGGVGPIPGETVLDKRAWAIKKLDRLRRLLVYEPRGHADMYGCFVTEPDDGEGDVGVLFFHNAGFSTACGHGTIALATWAIESGIVKPSEPETQMVIDVPSGRLSVVARVESGRPVSVRFRNVPSFVHARGLSVETRSAGEVVVDVTFGGAFYASVDAGALGLAVEPANLARLVETGREIKDRLNAAEEIAHPVEPRLRDVYGTILFEEAEGPGLAQRPGSCPWQRDVLRGGSVGVRTFLPRRPCCRASPRLPGSPPPASWSGVLCPPADDRRAVLRSVSVLRRSRRANPRGRTSRPWRFRESCRRRGRT
jgi:proline racemase